MSRNYRFRIVNVFAVPSAAVRDRDNPNAAVSGGGVPSRLSGNPLAVIEDATGLSDAEMQQLALQFNLSESTFVLPSGEADARVRIFTPTFEMPFAGHPTLGTAHVLRTLGRGGDALRLHLNVGVIPVVAEGDVWTLTANVPTHRTYVHTRAQLAHALGLREDDIVGAPLWMNAGVEQLIVPLASVEAVVCAKPQMAAFLDYCSNDREAEAYVYARDGETGVVSRYFWNQHGAILEDPGTGSACANLGGYLLATGAAVPLAIEVRQGAATGRPCLLRLTVDANRRIHVGGRVVELMRGELQLD